MPDAHGACVIFIVGFAVGLTPGCRRGRGLLHHPRRLYAIRILWRRRRTLRCPPIDRLEKHRQLRSAQTHRSALGPGPNESSPAPQSLIKQTEAVLAIPENLDFVASTPTKDKNLTGVRALVQCGLYQSAQPFKSPAHICYAGNQPDPHATRRAQHDRSNSRIMTRSARASSAPRIFTCPVPQTWISRHSPAGGPPAAGCSTAGSSAADGATRIGRSVTGSELQASAVSSPRRYWLRQLNSWFALRLWRRAITGTETPRSSVSKTICNFSCADQRRRRRTPSASSPLTLGFAVVPTCAPSGHVRSCPRKTTWAHNHTSDSPQTWATGTRLRQSAGRRGGSGAFGCSPILDGLRAVQLVKSIVASRRRRTFDVPTTYSP